MEEAVLLGVLGMCGVEDVKRKELCGNLILLGGILGVVLHLYYGRLEWWDMLGGVSVGLVLLLVSFLTDEKIGKGDGLLIMVMGIYLGLWKNLALVWMASVLAGAFGIYFYLSQNKGRSYSLPFAPFLLVSYVTYLAMSGGVLGA